MTAAKSLRQCSRSATNAAIYDVDIEFKDANTLEVYGNIWGIGKTVYRKKLK